LTDKYVVLVTCANAAEARRIARAVVEERLAACVNILPGMTSIYRWEGKIAKDNEAVMIIKTRASLAEATVAATRRRHSYTNPALLVIPVEGGSADYLGWLMQGTRPK